MDDLATCPRSSGSIGRRSPTAKSMGRGARSVDHHLLEPTHSRPHARRPLPGQIARNQAKECYLASQPGNALTPWQAQDTAPGDDIEVSMLADMHALQGDDHALLCIEKLRGDFPAQAAILLAQLRAFQERPEEAASALEEAFHSADGSVDLARFSDAPSTWRFHSRRPTSSGRSDGACTRRWRTRLRCMPPKARVFRAAGPHRDDGRPWHRCRGRGAWSDRARGALAARFPCTSQPHLPRGRRSEGGASAARPGNFRAERAYHHSQTCDTEAGWAQINIQRSLALNGCAKGMEHQPEDALPSLPGGSRTLFIPALSLGKNTQISEGGGTPPATW